MPKTREADAKKNQRISRERRHYTGADLGPPCPACKAKVPTAMTDAGYRYHPCCDPAAREAMTSAVTSAKP